jgi:hypothetical protein
MASKKGEIDFQGILHSLNSEERRCIENLNAFMISLGFITKITAMARKRTIGNANM